MRFSARVFDWMDSVMCIWWTVLTVTTFSLISLLPVLAIAAGSPYPPSPAIEQVIWDTGSLAREAVESDLFPLTWAGDGDLYTTWGDGWGFSGGGRSGGKSLLGVSRVSGGSTSYSGSDLWDGVGKSHGIIAVDGALYMIVTEQGNGWSRAKIGRSTDRGRTWSFNSGWDFDEPGGVFASACFLQFGQDYRGARDNYVYGYSEKRRNVFQPDIVLFRVPKTQITNRGAYEFFAGVDGQGNPEWTANVSQMRPVFSHPKGVGWGMQAMYHPVFKRYLLTVRHNDSAGWGIYDAPEPWGPWTTVAYYDSGWLDSVRKFTFSFTQKWMSTDGTTMWMVFSGVDKYDAFNVIKATFVPRSGPVDDGDSDPGDDGNGGNPGGGDSDNGAVKIWLEAEEGMVIPPMSIEGDEQTSGGLHIWAPSGSGNVYDPLLPAGEAQYVFTAPTDDTYVIWGKVRAEGMDHNSFHVAVDGDYEDAALWDTVNTKEGPPWQWDQINDRGVANPVFFFLEAGSHTLHLKQREAGAKLDKILITNDLDYVPFDSQ